MADSQKQDYSNGFVYFKAPLKLGGSNVGEVIEIPGEVLATDQGISVDQLRYARAEALAKGLCLYFELGEIV